MLNLIRRINLNNLLSSTNSRVITSIRTCYTEKRDDNLLNKSSLELPSSVESIPIPIEKNSLAKAFESLFDTFKKDECQVKNILDSREFEFYCRQLKKNSPTMDVNELLTVLKVLNRLRIKSNTKLMQQILHLLKENINYLTLSQLAFFNLLLSSMESTPLIEALKIAIPMIFNLHISEQLDHDNADEIQKIFHHITLTKMKVSNNSYRNLISSLTLHGNSLPIHTTISVLLSITRLSPKLLAEPTTIKLLTNCLDTINSRKIILMPNDFNLISSALYRMVLIYKESKMKVYYNPKFIEKIIELLINDDLGFNRAFSVISILNDISYVSYPLLDYVDKKIVQNETILKTLELSKLKTLIQNFSCANYKSENWEILKSLLHENSALHEDIPAYIPAIKLTAELLSLGFVSRILLQKVLQPEFLTEHLRFFSRVKNYSPLSYLRTVTQVIQLLHPEHADLLPPKIFFDVAYDKIPESVDELYKEVLEYIFGRHSVLCNVRTSYGHRLDFVINFDESGKAVEFSSNKITTFEELPLQKVRPVAVLFQSENFSPINYRMKLKGVFELRRRTLEQMGINEVLISTTTLESLNDNEKCDYIEREIRHWLT